ncbi:MAG TPA: (2Fe-2S) ferredoxin domain-containing protein [Aliidongia sp.]|nr:(2Fe-2S) ferredoxin domain-containing protein [Aliidongia sp.]
MESAERPYYRTHVFVCTNVRPPGHERGCCTEKGSEKLRNYMKVRAKELGLPETRINNAGCLDRCELGPVMVIYPEGIWYRYDTREDIDEILTKHLVAGERVERLMLHPDQAPAKG